MKNNVLLLAIIGGLTLTILAFIVSNPIAKYVNCSVKHKRTFESSQSRWGIIKVDSNPNYISSLALSEASPFVFDTVSKINYIHRDFVPRSNICNDTIWFELNCLF